MMMRILFYATYVVILYITNDKDEKKYSKGLSYSLLISSHTRSHVADLHVLKSESK